MPNHTQQTVRIKGNIDALIDRGFISVTEEPWIDFNGIIPMPDSMHIESGTRQANGRAALLGGPDFHYLRSMEWYESRYPGCDTPEKLLAHMKEHDPEAVEIAQKSIDNEREHGAKDWYQWARINWGTKWNAYDAREPERYGDRIVVVSFSTAWNIPEPVYTRLREMGYQVDGLYHDEYDNQIHEIGDGYEYFYTESKITYDSFMDSVEDGEGK